jgi:4-hydroxyphenylacetate 3-monooxygenase
MTFAHPSPISAATLALPVRPPTGEQYLGLLRDDRAVYLAGQRLADIANHPAFAGPARSIARLYDALQPTHDLHTTLTRPTDTGRPGFTHAFFRVPHTPADLLASQQAIAAWARLTYGWMGRSPDYKAALFTTFGAAPDFFGPFAGNARAWYARAQHTLPFTCHALVNPPIDRHLPPERIGDVLIRPVRETSAGIIVSGAKVVATSAPISTHVFVGQTGKSAGDDPALALAFIAPIAAPGIRLICREPFTHPHHAPFDAPLAARFDENDAILTFTDVLIPWENVLIHRDVKRTKAFFTGAGFVNAFLFHGATRLAVKLDFLVGLLSRCLQATGADEHRPAQVHLGEAIAWRHLIWSLSTAMAAAPEPWTGRDPASTALAPQRQAALAYATFAPQCVARVREIIHTTVASGLVYLPAAVDDLLTPETRPLIDRYVRGSKGMPADQRIKLMKLMWDAVGSAFAGRHDLYERHYAGSPDDVRLQALAEAQRYGRLEAMHTLVDRCLAEYDLHGWVDPAWATIASLAASPPAAAPIPPLAA